MGRFVDVRDWFWNDAAFVQIVAVVSDFWCCSVGGKVVDVSRSFDRVVGWDSSRGNYRSNPVQSVMPTRFCGWPFGDA